MGIFLAVFVGSFSLFGGHVETNGLDNVVECVPPVASRQFSEGDGIPNVHFANDDALLAAAEHAASEARQFVRDLKANGVKDDLEVMQELAEKIAAGTMTEEDDRRLQRIVRASEQWYELERIRMRRYCPPPRPRHWHRHRCRRIW